MTQTRHEAGHSFASADHELVLGGIKLSTLAARVGQTPFYVYERQAIAERVRQLRAALPSQVEIHYAVKANPMPAVVQFLCGLVDGLDVASGGEMKVALDAGMDPAEISMAGPGKSELELGQAVAAGICINVESPREVTLAHAKGEALGIQPRLAVRVNPDFELKSSGMKMGGGSKQFGIDSELVPGVIRRILELDMAFEGLHIFSGSQNLRCEAIHEAQAKSLALAKTISAEANTALKTLNIGGGFGIPYFPGEKALDLKAVGDGLHELLQAPDLNLGDTRIVIELGRYLVAEAGVYVCKVLDRKISRGQVFLVTDGGLHHHLAASGNFGQVLRKNYPVSIGTQIDSTKLENASVVGPLCTPLDLLADRMNLAVATEGDLVVVFQSGAYGLSASPTRFLSHPATVEVLV